MCAIFTLKKILIVSKASVDFSVIMVFSTYKICWDTYGEKVTVKSGEGPDATKHLP